EACGLGCTGVKHTTEGPRPLTIACNAPTSPLGGPVAPSPLASAARSGRSAGRARVLPRLPAPLQQRPAAALRRPALRHDLVGPRRQPARARALPRLPAPLALRGPARLRGDRP